MSPGSVTQLLLRLRNGHDSALGPLVRRYWPLLLRRAAGRIAPALRRVAGVEDVAQQALWDLCRGLREGSWQRLDDRHDLVALLLRLTDCRALNQVEHELAQVRGGGGVRDEAALGDEAGSGAGLERLAIDPWPEPGQEVMEEEWAAYLLGQLAPGLRPFAELLLADWPIARIAEALCCSERTVARKVALIRARWLEILARP